MNYFPFSLFSDDDNKSNESRKIVSSTNKPAYLHNNDNKTVSLDGLYKIVIVLDESGSMQPIRSQIIRSINDLITEQKQIEERPATFTLVKFNNNVNRVMTNKLLKNVHNLDSLDYTPNGSTALYDAIGDTIQWFRNEKDVLMVIVTDGQENASTKYTKHQINKLIDEKKLNNNWSYVYLSSDLSTEIQGNNIGLQKSAYSANCQVAHNNFGNYIGNDLNKAISKCRKDGTSVQSQL